MPGLTEMKPQYANCDRIFVVPQNRRATRSGISWQTWYCPRHRSGSRTQHWQRTTRYS